MSPLVAFSIVGGSVAGIVICIPLGLWLWDLRVIFRPGYHRFLFLDPTTKIRTSFMTRLDPDAEYIDLPHGRYGLDQEAVTYSGKFRIPTFDFIKGCAEPIIISDKELQLSSKVAATDYQKVGKNVAVAQLLEAMRKGIFNPQSMLSVLLVVMIIGFAVIGYLLYSLQSN